MIAVPRQRHHGPQVTVSVTDTDDALDVVVERAREADRRKVPLELVLQPDCSDLPLTGPQRARLVQRLDLAVERARSVAPGLDIRMPSDNPLSATQH